MRIRDTLIWGNGELARCMYYYLDNDYYKVYSGGVFQGGTCSDFKSTWFRETYGGLVVSDESYVKLQPWSSVKANWLFESMKHGKFENTGMFLPIGYKNCNKLREDVFHESKMLGISPLTFIHSRAYIASDVEVGEGSLLFENVGVQTGAKLGRATILWGGIGTHVGHSSIVEDFCFISTGSVVSGGCKIGHNSFLGINTSIKDGVEIAHSNIIGAGAVITKNTKPFEVYLAGVNNLYHKRSDEIK